MSSHAFSAMVDESVSNFWENQFTDLSLQISGHRQGFAKSAVANTPKVLDSNALIRDTDRDPTEVVLRRTEALLARYSKSKGTADWNSFTNRLETLKRTIEKRRGALGKAAAAVSDADTLYLAAQALNREIMLANPELDFTDLVFIERGIIGPGEEIDGDHMCDQYYGHNCRTGGGMFILKNFATDPRKVDIMDGLAVPSGLNRGKSMTGGTFLSPDLSFDGKTIVFSWSSGGREKWRPENPFNIFSVNVDGTNLQRLTDGDYDDIHPCWIPGGRIVFISTRRGGYGRCHGRPVPTYTLYSMKPDGSDIISRFRQLTSALEILSVCECNKGE
jgi:hypothetical protein